MWFEKGSGLLKFRFGGGVATVASGVGGTAERRWSKEGSQVAGMGGASAVEGCRHSGQRKQGCLHEEDEQYPLVEEEEEDERAK